MKVVLGLLLLIVLTGCGMEQVDEGYRGIYTNFGKVVGEPLPPGLHFYNPISGSITEIEVREQKLDGKEGCFTLDTQNVQIQFVLTYYPDPMKIGALFIQFGRAWDEKIVPQVVKGSLKDAIGRYRADDLVGKREAVRTEAEREIREGLAARFVIVTKLDLTNLDFDDEYEKAVEAKVVAIQKAAEAKNKTVQVEEEARQTVASAKADAEAMRIKSQALSQNKGLVSFEAVKKWNGKLPVNMYGSAPIPFLNLKGE